MTKDDLCSFCHATGFVGTNVCQECGGRGRTADEYRYKVTARWYDFTCPLGSLLLEYTPPLPGDDPEPTTDISSLIEVALLRRAAEVVPPLEPGDPLWGLPTGGTFAVDHALERRARLESMKARLGGEDRFLYHHALKFRRGHLGPFLPLGYDHAEKADLHDSRPRDVPADSQEPCDSHCEGRGPGKVEP